MDDPIDEALVLREEGDGVVKNVEFLKPDGDCVIVELVGLVGVLGRFGAACMLHSANSSGIRAPCRDWSFMCQHISGVWPRFESELSRLGSGASPP